jgi:NAD(P)H-hydrate epimerase
MHELNPQIFKILYKPARDSHKGENGRVMVIAGSKLFHAASLWPLSVASRIVDMVFYCSVPENNELVERAKEEFRNGIIIPRSKAESYIKESDAILIGPGLPREEGREEGDDDTKELSERLLKKYSEKKWVIDGGSLQVISPDLLPKTSIITPHKKEFEKLFRHEASEKNAMAMANKFNIVILLKGEVDFVCDSTQSVRVEGGNPGMTKGGTGDVLAGLVAALYAKNDAFVSACAASYINKKAAESLEKRVGVYFNASDLADEIPVVMKNLL